MKVMINLINWIVNKIRPKHQIDIWLEELEGLDSNNPEHYKLFCRIYYDLFTAYAIRYNYRKNRYGELLHDPYDLKMAQLYDELNKEFRNKIFNETLQT